MSNRPSALLYAVALAAVLLCPLAARAAAPTADPFVQKAVAKYATGGADALRRYVFRTRMIYGLDYASVVAAYEAQRAAVAAAPAIAQLNVAAMRLHPWQR